LIFCVIGLELEMETGAVGFHRASHKHVTRPVSRVLYRARMGARR
jgi:hypothetical protein